MATNGADGKAGTRATGKQIVKVRWTSEMDRAGMDTLVGDFVECGSNHDKKVFKKSSPDDDSVGVYLYFWDQRDGADFSGWWFGDKVGGSQVWSRCEKTTNLPPKSGWRIPWDGPVQDDLQVEPQVMVVPPVKAKVEAKAEAAEETQNGKSQTTTAMDERAQAATDRVVITEIEATQALDSCQAMLEGEVTEDAARVVEELLKAQQQSVIDTHKSLAVDIVTARRNAPTTIGTLTALTRRLRNVQVGLTRETQECTQLIATKKAEVEEEEREAKAAAELQQAEQTDVTKLQTALPAAIEVVTKAEAMLESVYAAAQPLETQLGEEMTEAVKVALRETEAATAKAQAEIQDARKHIAQKTNSARLYAPGARKVALTEYSELQLRLSEAARKLVPYERVRKEYEERVDAKKVLADATSKLGFVELEVENVMGTLAYEPHKTEDSIVAAEASLMAVLKSLASAMKFVDQRIKSADGAFKADLALMQERGQESKKRLEESFVKLRGQSEQVQVQTMLRKALEKVEKAEECLGETAVAEAPFLKGIVELMPSPEAMEAIANCEKALRTVEAAANQARTFLNARADEVPTFHMAVRQSTTEELEQLHSRAEAVVQQSVSFKRETVLRKTTMLLHSVMEKVVDAEAKVKAASTAVEPLIEKSLEELSVGKLKEMSDRTLEAEKVAAVAIVEARKAVTAKQKGTVEDRDTPASYVGELAKLQVRLSTAQDELGKARKAAISGERAWKGKQILQDREETLRQVADELERVDILTTPLGDEPTPEAVQEMLSAVEAVHKMLSESVKSLESARDSVQGDFNTSLDKLLARAAQYQEKLVDVKAATTEMRERALAESMLKGCRELLQKVDDAVKEAIKAEAPYEKGDLLLDEASKAMEAYDAAMMSAQQAVAAARGFLTAKSLELRDFVPDVSRRGLHEISSLSDKIEAAVEKLAASEKKRDARQKDLLRQQAVASVATAETAVQRTILAATTLASKNLDDISSQEATEICERLSAAENEAEAKLEESRKLLLERKRSADDEAGVKEVADLMDKLGSVQFEMVKAKTTASEHEQKFVGKMLLLEARDRLKGLEADHTKAVEEAKPLTEQGGSIFLAASMAKMIVNALSDHMTSNGLTQDQLFAKMGGKKAKLSKAAFGAFVETLPKTLSRPDLALTPEQRAVVFEQADADKDGVLSRTEFATLFHERYLCVSGVSITDVFDIDSGAAIGKLEENDVVEAQGEPRTHDTLGIMRVQVKALKTGTTGWVTMQGNQGTTYLGPYTPYAAFARRLDRVVGTARASSIGLTRFISLKCGELRDCGKGPLMDAKAELAKFRPAIFAVQSKLDKLCKDIEEGKQEHAKREEAERASQEEKKERQAARLVIQAVTEKVGKSQSQLTSMKDTAAPIVSLGEAALANFETPLSTLAKVEDAARVVDAAVAEARASFKAHESKNLRIAGGPWIEARQELGRLKQRVDAVERESGAILFQAQGARDNLVAAKLGQVALAIRSSIQSRSITTGDLYAELTGNDPCISEAAFSKYLDSLDGLKLPTEQKRLLVLQQGAGDDDNPASKGINRWGFLRMLQRFSKCVKEIAITSEFDIKAKSTIRKLEVAEVVEVLDGPKTDDALGVTRLLARAMSDEATGWITVRGNQGTPFLQETEKPYYVSLDKILLQDGFPSEGCNDVATLKVHEVLELLEGPRQESVGNPARALGRAVKDSAKGWFTVMSRQGQECAKPMKITYTCRQAIALTSERDIQTCEVLRKLDRGELLTGLDEPVTDEYSGTMRLRAQANQDGMEGWVTMMGNAGTVYVQETSRQYSILKSIPLQRTFQAASDQIRMLSEGEVVDVLQGPKEESSEPVVRVRVRAASNGTSGWATLRQKGMRRWTSNYRCVAAIDLHDKVLVEGAKVVRRLDVGEMLELIDGPKEEPSLGALRVKVRATKDGVVGWVAAADSEGNSFVECISRV